MKILKIQKKFDNNLFKTIILPSKSRKTILTFKIRFRELMGVQEDI